MKIDEAGKSWTSRAGVVRVANAMNPLLWSMAVATPASWLAAYMFRDDVLLKDFFAIIGALPIVSALVAYFIYMFRDPNRLQSEEYQLKQQAIQILYKKDATREIVELVDDSTRFEIDEQKEEKQ